MKRYFIDGSCECGRIDDPSAVEDESGEWIKYEDYEAEKANGMKPQLSDVLAEIQSWSFYEDKASVHITRYKLEEILSKYFA